MLEAKCSLLWLTSWLELPVCRELLFKAQTLKAIQSKERAGEEKCFLFHPLDKNLLIITRFQIKLLKATFHNLPKQQHVFVHLCYLINLSTMSILYWGMLQKQSIARENDKIKLLPRNTSKEVPLLLVKQTNNPTSTPTKPVQKHGQRVSLCVLNETSGLACSRVGGLLA